MSKKFVKEVEYYIVEDNGIFSFIALIVLSFFNLIGFVGFIGEIVPEWNNTFFPLGWFLIGWILSVVLSLMPLIKREVYWRQKK